MPKRFLLLLLVLCCAAYLRAGDQPLAVLSGTYLVGNSQPVYKKLTDVANVLNDRNTTVAGNVIFELDSDYDGTTGESFPIVFNRVFSSWGTVTIRPKAGVSMRTTSGDPGAAPLITLNGSNTLVFDGRAGGSGGIAWLIRNTATIDAGATFLLINAAYQNTLTWLQLEGQTTTAGVVHIGSAEISGNMENTISYCAIRDRTDVTIPARPATGILCDGSEANTDNRFDHNHIFNFYNDGGNAYGIRMIRGARNSFITHNSIYQEQPLLNAASGTVLHGIYVSEPSANWMTISDNFIGGAAPECGGAPLTMVSAPNGYCVLTGIHFGDRLGPAGEENLCIRNTIKNIDITIDQLSLNVPGIFTGIYVLSQVSVLNNTIGNPDGHDAIKITSGPHTLHLRASMIMCLPYESMSITNNRMGGVTLAGKSLMRYPHDLVGIYSPGGHPVPGAAIEITGNTIGSTTIPDNIRSIGDSLPVQFSGIDFQAQVPIRCGGNKVAGASLGYSGTTVFIHMSGLKLCAFSKDLTITNNQISGISSASRAVRNPLEYDNSTHDDFAGIYAIAFEGGRLEISRNTIRGLRLTGTAPVNAVAGNTISLTGIHFRGGSSSAVYNNKIYDLSSSNDLGASAATMLIGIHLEQDADNMTLYNNLISLDNKGLSNNCEINGLRFRAHVYTSADKLYHNTVYIGGSSSSGNTASSAPVVYSGAGVGDAKTFFSIRNNLLVNGRTGGNGDHFIFRNMAPGSNWTAASSDTNVLVIADPAKVARWGSANLDSTQWKTTGGDAHSWFYTIAQLPAASMFMDAAGADLRIIGRAGKYVTGKGTPAAGIRTDYFSQLRNLAAPTIGAFEEVVPNKSPVISSHDGNAAVTMQVPENTTAVTRVIGADADADPLVYSLAGGEDETKFAINSSTGELSFLTAPDFEQPGDANGDNAYVVTVQATDGDAFAFQRFKIKITDANDHAPVITSYNGDAAVTLTVPENTTDILATVKATDADQNAVLAYSLVSEEDAAKFSLNTTTGELRFLAPPDYEQPGDGNGDNVYIVTVKASDGDSSATQRFKIKVRNVNDHVPVITSYAGADTVSVEIAENETAVATVKATDADGGSVIRYSIVAGGDGALFSVDPVTGVLTFVTAPDYDQPADDDVDNVCIVTVQASDGDAADTQLFEIRVTNDNDSPLIITATIQVAENTLAVTTLNASDADAAIVLGIEPGADGALFSLDPVTGVLSFISAPDFENPADSNGDNVYTVSVRMFDGAIVTILRLNITVTDAGGPTARMNDRSAAEPQVQQPLVLQMATTPGPGKGISLYSNPVRDKKFTLRMEGVAPGSYVLELYAADGKRVCRRQLNHAGPSVLYPVQLPVHLAAGTYILKVQGAEARYTEKLIVQ
ncbi:MAG: cadherin domain-containing protein [Chitinophagaceae bacterium]